VAENDHLPLTWHIALTTVYALTCYTVMKADSIHGSIGKKMRKSQKSRRRAVNSVHVYKMSKTIGGKGSRCASSDSGKTSTAGQKGLGVQKVLG